MERDSYIKQEVESRHQSRKTWHQIALETNIKFGTIYHGESLRDYYRRKLQGGIMPKKGKKPLEEATLQEDRELDKSKKLTKVKSRLYEEAKAEIERLEKERDAVVKIQNYETFEIRPKRPSGQSESIVVVLASDWHVEESVARNAVNGLNEYSLEIARQRAMQFFQGALRLTQIIQKDTRVDTMVLALLGDFISGSIHEDIAENTNLHPIEALIFAEELLISGIEFLLKHSKLNLIIPCHSGNHGRSTKEQRQATENGNSFEFYMYHVLAKHFEGNKRVKFLISDSAVSYLPVYGEVLRFSHGHGINYGGGVGGLFVPVYKAIARLNDGRRATIDCFGHFHQFRDGGTFVCNGSLIGYNAYALSKRISFEKPQQVLFAIEKTRGRTCTWPISFKI